MPPRSPRPVPPFPPARFGTQAVHHSPWLARVSAATWDPPNPATWRPASDGSGTSMDQIHGANGGTATGLLTFSRVWQAGTDFRNIDLTYDRITAGRRKIFGSNQPPNYFPTKMYRSAVTTGGDASNEIEYLMPVDTRMSYMVWLHFAEINVGVRAPGHRVFDIMLTWTNVTTIDIFKQVRGFTTFKWTYIVENLMSSTMSVRLVPVVGRPILCGLENYAMVPLETRTVPNQSAAMKALNVSLKIPARMGWNGDPCALRTWDAWEGVTCHPSNKGLVTTQL